MRNPLGPVCRALYRSRHKPEIPTHVIHANKEKPIAMVDVVLNVVAARRNQAKLRFRHIRRQKPRFARSVARSFQHYVLVIPRAPGSYIEALVHLFINEHILHMWRAERMPIEPILALLLFVFDRIEEGLRSE